MLDWSGWTLLSIGALMILYYAAGQNKIRIKIEWLDSLLHAMDTLSPFCVFVPFGLGAFLLNESYKRQNKK
jgi:hypothetical protein